jgi:ABC-type lipoprotein export system ATPase subunit
MTPAVAIDDAFVIYDSEAGGTPALQGLTLHVESGEIVVLLGPSGSGKTTLLRAVSGFERLTAGTARVFGTDVSRIEPRQAAAYRASTLGVLDQHYARSLSPDLSCRQTVALQLELLGHDALDAQAVALALLARVGLEHRADELPGTLSGGEQQRVAVCAAVAHRPKLVLADEPAGELDARNAEIVYRLLGELVREAGATALIVSHDTAAAAIADRLVHVRDGRVVEESRPGQAAALVVGHGGWVRLPEATLRALGAPSRVRLEQHEDGSLLVGDGDRGGSNRRSGSEHQALGQPPRVPRPAGEVVAELRDLGRRFDAGRDSERVVFSGLDASFRQGRFTAVVGRSGSGKTTLLHLLAGLERPSDGDVILLGVSLQGCDRVRLAELRRQSVALVTQEPGLVPYLTALENVELGLQLRGANGDAARAAEQALVEVGLGRRIATPAAKLSAGERQRVAVARALAVDVALLLVDEPTARLDETNGRETADLLARAAHERGLAVVCATHDRVLVERADDSVLLDETVARSPV